MFTLNQKSAVFFSLFFLTNVAGAEITDGVNTAPASESATPASINFDPPCSFSATLPLIGVPYMNLATESVILDGEGSVLNECANFGVSGYSAPNFLAWNCGAVNNDGTVPKLPMEIQFTRSIASVSIKVASNSNAGSTATLRVYNAKHQSLGSVAVTLTNAAQTLSLAKPNTKYMRLEGPCVMIADDLAITH